MRQAHDGYLSTNVLIRVGDHQEVLRLLFLKNIPISKPLIWVVISYNPNSSIIFKVFITK